MPARRPARVRTFVGRVARRALGEGAAERLLRPLYRAGPHECPICESRFDAFLPMPAFLPRMAAEKGFPYSMDEMETLNHAAYLCPVCLESDRSRLYALHFRRVLAGMAAEGRTCTFVDFAPSRRLGAFLRALPGVRYRSADLYMPGVDDRVDITDLRVYGDDSVDAFLCSHVLEHVPDFRRALAELRRILRVGGSGVVMVPIALPLTSTYEVGATLTEDERWRHYGQGDHVRLFAKGDFVGALADAGFTVAQLGADDFGRAEWERAGIAPRSVLYVVSKRCSTSRRLSSPRSPSTCGSSSASGPRAPSPTTASARRSSRGRCATTSACGTAGSSGTAPSRCSSRSRRSASAAR